MASPEPPEPCGLSLTQGILIVISEDEGMAAGQAKAADGPSLV